MAPISEESIVNWLKDERWLYNLFGLKRLEIWKNVYFDEENFREADLVGIDREGKIYAFEVKNEGLDIGVAFDQTSEDNKKREDRVCNSVCYGFIM